MAEIRRKKPLWIPMIVMVLVVVLLVAIIGGIKGYGIYQLIQRSKVPPPPAIVTAMKAESADWQPEVKAIGTLRAVRGVDVTTEIAGLVRNVSLKSGEDVKAGTLLVELNTDADVAQLHSLQAAADLSATTLKRDQAQLAADAIPQAQVDADQADLKSKRAQVEEQEATIAKKTIRAPFAGRIGISSVNPGQYLNPGDKVASLQTIDPIYFDFNVPQEQLASISVGQNVTLASDAFPKQTFAGKITAIDSRIDPNTRNVQIEATIHNPQRQLLPGMFGRVAVESGAKAHYVTVPQTAVTYNPYGATVFVAENKKDASGKETLTAQQTFVTTGPTRGDQVAILTGLKEGALVVTSGQLKLKTGSPLKIDNSVQPLNNPAPTPQEQ